MAQSVSGFRFFCGLLEIIYQDEGWKTFFAKHKHDGTPIEKKDALHPDAPMDVRAIRNALTTLARKARRRAPHLVDMLADTMNRYYEDGERTIDPTILFGESAVVTNSFEGLFTKQNSVANDIFASMALVITMAAGTREGPFYIGAEEVRQLLGQALDCLGYPGTDFIPEECFRLVDRGFDEQMLKLLVLGLYSAMKFKMPHKNTEAQIQANYQRGRMAIHRLTQTDPDSLLYGSVGSAGEAGRICDAIRDATKELTQTHPLPNHRPLAVDAFYTFPLMEAENETASNSRGFLSKDLGVGIRSVIIGAQGSGKTLLAKVAARTCMEDAQSRTGFYGSCARKMGLDTAQYVPLFLSCPMLPRDFTAENCDLIAEALDQTCHWVRKTRFAGQLDHYRECRRQVLQYYRQLARRSELLLIIEDLSTLKSAAQEELVRCLERFDLPNQAKYAKINLLVTTQRLPRSIMNRFSGYSRVQIVSLPVEETIRNLTAAGIGCHDAEQYLKRIAGDHMLQEYLNTSPEHLIRLLCADGKDARDPDLLIHKSVQERLDSASTAEVAADDCEALLTALAVTLVEKRSHARTQETNACGARSRFRKNCIDSPDLRAMLQDVTMAEPIWNHIQERMLLLTHGPINSYQFCDRLFACSLTADYYLELLSGDEAPDWLSRFNRIHPEDLCTILRMVLARYFRTENNSLAAHHAGRSYRFQLFVQSICAYMLGCYTMQEVDQVLRVLCAILFDSRMEESFRAEKLDKLWHMLRRVYWERYDYYKRCWGQENEEQLARYRGPAAAPCCA